MTIVSDKNQTRFLPRTFQTALILLFFGLLTSLPSRAEDPGSFRISQASVRLPQITAWLEVLTTADQFVPDMAVSQLTASIGTRPAQIQSITPFSETGEGMAAVLLVDISKSLKPAQFDKLREALLAWVDAMSEKDRTAILTFGTGVRQEMDFSADKAALKETIGRLNATDTDTQLHRGLVEAMSVKNRTDPDLPLRRIIITLSDGRDDYAAGLRREEVLAAMQTDRIPLFAIGFSPPPATPQKDADMKKLGEFARASGGALLKAENTSFPEMITRLRDRIQQVYVARVVCDACQADNAVHRLQMNLTAGQRAFTDGLDLRLIRVAEPEPVATPHPPALEQPVNTLESGSAVKWFHIVAVLTVLILIAGLVLLRRKKKQNARTNTPTIPAEADVGQEPASPVAMEIGMPGRYLLPGDNNAAPKPIIISRPPEPVGLRLRLTPIGVHPSFSGCEITLVDRLVIGRTEGPCSVPVPGDDQISRRHCELIRKGDAVAVADLNTTNGTRVNGVRITGLRHLEADDILLLGRTEIRISIL